MNTSSTLTFSIGIDLGQRQDPAAIAIVQCRQDSIEDFDHVNWRPTAAPQPPVYAVRRLERVPLGTPYTHVADRIAALDRHPALRGRSTFIVDATGLGAPVVDMLRARRLDSPILPVILTSGQSTHYDGGAWYVPKLDLLANLQLLFEHRRLLIVRRTPYSGDLVKELTDIRARRHAGGYLRIGADAAGQHDDLALAVALAVWPTHKPRTPAPGKVGPVPHRLL